MKGRREKKGKGKKRRENKRLTTMAWGTGRPDCCGSGLLHPVATPSTVMCRFLESNKYKTIEKRKFKLC